MIKFFNIKLVQNYAQGTQKTIGAKMNLLPLATLAFLTGDTPLLSLWLPPSASTASAWGCESGITSGETSATALSASACLTSVPNVV